MLFWQEHTFSVRGFVLVGIGCLVLVLLLNELAVRALNRNRRGKRRRRYR